MRAHKLDHHHTPLHLIFPVLSSQNTAANWCHERPGCPTSTIPSSSSVSMPASLPSPREWPDPEVDGGDENSSDSVVDARLSEREGVDTNVDEVTDADAGGVGSGEGSAIGTSTGCAGGGAGLSAGGASFSAGDGAEGEVGDPGTQTEISRSATDMSSCMRIARAGTSAAVRPVVGTGGRTAIEVTQISTRAISEEMGANVPLTLSVPSSKTPCR